MMKMTDETTGGNDSKRLIAVRPKAHDPVADAFWQTAMELGVSGTDLARRAIANGLKSAAEEILQEKSEESSRIKRTAKRGLSANFSQLCGCVEMWQSPILMPFG